MVRIGSKYSKAWAAAARSANTPTSSNTPKDATSTMAASSVEATPDPIATPTAASAPAPAPTPAPTPANRPGFQISAQRKRALYKNRHEASLPVPFDNIPLKKGMIQKEVKAATKATAEAELPAIQAKAKADAGAALRQARAAKGAAARKADAARRAKTARKTAPSAPAPAREGRRGWSKRAAARKATIVEEGGWELVR